MANESAAASNDVSTVPLQPLVFQCRACRMVVGDSVNFDCSVRSLACVALTGRDCGENIDVKRQIFVRPPRATQPPPPPRLQKKKKKKTPRLSSGASGLTVDPHPQATVLPRDAAGPSGRAAATDSNEDDESSAATAAVAFVSLSCSGCGAALGKRFGERGLPARLRRIAGLFCLEVDSISSYELGKPELVAAVSSAAGKREGAGAPTTTTPNGKDALALSSLLSRVAELEEELVKVQNVVLGHNEALANLQELQQQQGQRR